MKAPRCPKGHPVGKRWGRKGMTTVYTCNEQVCAKPSNLAAMTRNEQLRVPAQEGAPIVPVLLATEETHRQIDENAPKDMKAAHELWLARIKAGKVPLVKSNEEALQWSQDRLVKLLPEAVSELQHQLRYGNEKARSAAVETILRANGVAQKDAAAGTTPTILISLGESSSTVPFLQRFVDAKKKSED